MNTDVNLLSFNSTLVQLKAIGITKSKEVTTCFNSTLVQLKDTPGAYSLGLSKSFQFYLSSIKRLSL